MSHSHSVLSLVMLRAGTGGHAHAAAVTPGPDR
jgi:hypothetical protein